MISIDRISLTEAAARRGSGVSLDGGSSHSPWDRWTYYPSPATHILQCDSRTKITALRSANGELQRWENPLTALAWLGDQCNEPAMAGPPFKGGWVGNLSYDLGRCFEALPTLALDDLNLPLFTFTHHGQVVAIDHAEQIAYDCRLSSGIPPASIRLDSNYGFCTSPPKSDFTRAAYEDAVRRAIDYIRAGDIFQVNLAQRFTAGLPKPPDALYRELHERFPAWFGACLDFGDHALLCNSPELFLRITPQIDARGIKDTPPHHGPRTTDNGPRKILTRPIKGTRPRGHGLDAVLLNSIKDQAELNMIIDLERNDLGRLCRIGSVKVTEPRMIETHPTVYHGAATIEGVLREDVTFVDLLRATFPGGSVTGAPKIRAMQIIEALEPVRRGPYCGAIGYLSADGHMQFNVAIRTMIARADRVFISVGGGIVADSRPDAEYDETIVKATAMFQALSSK